MFVCLFVCFKTPPREMSKYRHIIYGSKQNLSGKDVIYISSPPDQLSGRYCPETGLRWKKMMKNRHFFKNLSTFPMSDRLEMLNEGKGYQATSVRGVLENLD